MHPTSHWPENLAAGTRKKSVSRDLIFGIVLFFGFLLIYPFVAISMSAIVYLFMLPISYFHYKKLKKQNDDKDLEDDDFEDIL